MSGDDGNNKNAGGQDHYQLNKQDRGIVGAAILLLNKISRSPFLKLSQVASVATALYVLRRLPQINENVSLSIDLSGPRRRFGEREISHHWNITVDPRCIEITAAGYFHQQSTGGDTFLSMMWSAQPGCKADFTNMLGELWMVDDAQPFEQEVASLDLSQPGYNLDINPEPE